MKHLLSTVIFAAALPFAGAANADAGKGCHFHGAKAAAESVVVGCAKGKITELVGKAKIENTWKAATLQKAEVVEVKGKKEWKLSFINAAATDVKKKTLYAFYNLNGNFIAANFTGE